MKKQSGFTLIELVVAMAVLGLIMGAMVYLFGSSVTSLHVGARQEVVYEEARLLMNELKTTLRYADKDSIKYPEPDVLTYSGTMWDRHMDISQGNNKAYNIRVEWQDAENGLKRLKVTRVTDGKQETTLFPTDSANSVFKEGSQFPITPEEIMVNGSSIVMYKIVLPLQYEFNGQMKTQTLETKVVPSKDEVTETPEEKMLKEYTSLVSIWHKLKNGEVLTSSERNSLDDFKKFFGTSNDSLWQLGNNDKIREYLLSEKYGGAWFSVNINGKTVYMNPYGYGDTNVPITVDNVFLIGYTDPDKTTGWNVNYVYNPENNKWYHLIKKGGVSVSLPINKVKDLINENGRA
ncbi:prepilin-type N-terminal cleavage/methylation domain-containing protein, partial [Phascolarctobacterium faecium]|uniref:prepilin-type N-terminal cleavage/methylation domain-containing protein n=1 Tax=Phascolarctobacterium faecium TaxID=33025 RepID=UPI00307DA007